MDYQSLLQYSFFGNTVQEYLFAIGVFVLTFSVLKIFKNSVVKRLRRFAEKTKNDFDDLLIAIIQSIGYPFYLLVSIGLAFQFIEQPPFLKTLGFYGVLFVALYTAVMAIQRIIEYLFDKGIRARLKEDANFDPSIVRLLANALKAVVWIVAALLVLQNLGYNITTLVAGLGIGGIAIAFALQGVLADVFASFSIYLDKPFRTGDFIIVGDEMGTVKQIGIKSTRIQTLEGEELIISNKELTETRIHNYRGFEKRRMTFTFGIKYETPTEKVRAIPQMVKDIIGKIELAEINRIHFTDFGDFSLNFGAVYYIASGDFTVHKDIQHEINLALMERFEQEGIEFAYPTQTIYVKK